MLAAWRRLARAEARLASGGATLAGVDEAGRGPLAGPVVAAAVVLDPGGRWDGLNDSKKIDAGEREALYARVCTQARAFAFAVVGPRIIDRFNIRQARLGARRRAISRLAIAPDLVLVDGDDPVPGLAFPQRTVVDGDARLLSVAAASIVAKVVRDRIMERMDLRWPGYGFARHKGYGTPEHLDAIARLGPCPLHRYSFAPVRVQELPLGV